MKHRIVPMAVVAFCLGLPSLAISQPNDNKDRRDLRDLRRDQPGRPNEPRNEPNRVVPPPPAGNRPSEQDLRSRYEEHLRQAQDAARARRKDIRKDIRAWNDGRSLRAETHRRDLAQTYANLVNIPEARSELATHADRMARLNRILDLAEEKAETTIVNRANELIRRENARSARVIAAIRARTGGP